MNEKRNLGKKEKAIVWILTFVLVIMAAMVTASLIGDNIKQCAKDLIYGHGEEMAEKEFMYSDVQAANYNVTGNHFVSSNNDPQLILADIEDYVKEVTVKFASEVQEDINVEIFFSFSELAFNPAQCYIAQIEKGADSATFQIGKKITDLRLDMGTEENVEFELDSIVLNENVEGFSIGQVINCMKENTGTAIWYDRVEILSVLFLFIAMHFLVKIPTLYGFLFDKRWIVALVLLLFMVFNRYNGDSIAMYDSYIQTGKGNDYIKPVLGKARAIRSDEWVVDTPIAMSSRYLENPYGKYNDIIRGTTTLNGGSLSFSSIASPQYIVKIAIIELFGYDYGVSFGWYVHIMLVFLFTIEFFLILSNGNKLLSACGACLLVFSSFFLWWGFPSMFLGAHASVVCAYHFIHCDDWKKKIPLAIGTSIFTAGFVTLLYPAWQVPLGFAILAVLVSLIHDSWDKIKKMSKAEWFVIIVALIFCGSIVVSYLFSRAEYTNAIMQTEYPGSRIEYGGFSIHKLFNYIPAVLFAYKDFGNPSEAGTCIGFFPVPMILALYIWVRSKKKDWLISGLMLVGIFLTFYTTVGLLPVIAKYTMMTFSTAARAVDILGYIQVVLLVRVLSLMKEKDQLSVKPAVALSVGMAAILLYASNYYVPGYMSKLFLMAMFFVLVFIFVGMIARIPRKWKNASVIAMIVMAVVTGAAIRPINKGHYAITSKPLAKEITRLAQEDKGAKWLAAGGGIVLPSFAVACGAPTINSVNTYPNMELWKTLDPSGEYNEVYNRYAHINLQFVEEDTSMELLQEDCLQLNLSYRDVVKTEAKYIVSQMELNDINQWVSFREIYNEAGSHIYKIEYK